MKRMKFIGALAIVSLFLNACNSDDGNSASIVGKWNDFQTITKTGNQPEQTQPYEENQIGCEKDFQEFSSDNRFRDVSLYIDTNNQCAEYVENEGNFGRDGDLLTIDGETYTITKITGSELRYKATEVVNGVSITVTKVFRRR